VGLSSGGKDVTFPQEQNKEKGRGEERKRGGGRITFLGVKAVGVLGKENQEFEGRLLEIT